MRWFLGFLIQTVIIKRGVIIQLTAAVTIKILDANSL